MSQFNFKFYYGNQGSEGRELELLRFTGHENISQLFDFDLELKSMAGETCRLKPGPLGAGLIGVSSRRRSVPPRRSDRGTTQRCRNRRHHWRRHRRLRR
jgi:hypothetical protein